MQLLYCSTLYIVLTEITVDTASVFNSCLEDADCEPPSVICTKQVCACNTSTYKPVLLYDALDNMVDVICREPEPSFISNDTYNCYGEGEMCRCEEGKVNVEMTREDWRNGICYPVAGKLGASCKISSLQCDFNEGFICQKAKCHCSKPMMYNFTTASCQSRAEYMNLNNLTDYKVTHGVYCIASSDCLEGLTCATNYTCSCPEQCPYLKEEDVCDCGPGDGLWGPCLIGIGLGLFIVICWAYRIRVLIRTFSGMNSRGRVRNRNHVRGNVRVATITNHVPQVPASNPPDDDKVIKPHPLPYPTTPQPTNLFPPYPVNVPASTHLHLSGTYPNNAANPLPLVVGTPQPARAASVMSVRSGSHSASSFKPHPERASYAAPMGFHSNDTDKPPSYEDIIKKKE